RRLAPNAVTADALSGVRLVVLIQAPLSPTATTALTRFAADGGKLVLINQEASLELYSAVSVGAAPAAPPARYERIAAMPGEALAAASRAGGRRSAASRDSHSRTTPPDSRCARGCGGPLGTCSGWGHALVPGASGPVPDASAPAERMGCHQTRSRCTDASARR